MILQPACFSLSAISIALLSCSFAVFAEQTAQSKDVEDIEVIEVYAQKRLQRIQDVSVAVTSISGLSISFLQSFTSLVLLSTELIISMLSL